jgi:hypothetical protein
MPGDDDGGDDDGDGGRLGQMRDWQTPTAAKHQRKASSWKKL